MAQRNKIVICALEFPNDPTHTVKSHMMFCADFDGHFMTMYCIDSLTPKKQLHVSREPWRFLQISEEERIANKFNLNSVVNCADAFKVDCHNYSLLDGLVEKQVSPTLARAIHQKIADLKAKGKQTVFEISEDNLVRNNPALEQAARRSRYTRLR